MTQLLLQQSWIARSEFGVNNTKVWIHPALDQQLRLLEV